MLDIFLPNKLLFYDENIMIYGKKEYQEEFISRLASNFINKKNSILDFFNIDNIRQIKINLFDNKENLIVYLKKYFEVSNYCVGAVCNGDICYYIEENILLDYSKARIYDCINYT